MFRCTFHPILSVLLVSAAAHAEPSAFQNVHSAKGGFSVEMPGRPNEKTIQLKNGTVVHRYTMPITLEQHFTIAVMKFQGRNVKTDDPQKTLTAYRDDEHHASTLVTDKTIALGKDKVLGREYVFELDDMRDAFLRERIFLVGANMYILTIIGEKKLVRSKAADRFFESFKLEEKGDIAPVSDKKP